jgi:VWFA-related protein
MKEIFIGCSIIFLLFSNLMGQSGRKINIEPTPTPAVENQEFSAYSESKPGNNRIRNISPLSNNKTENKNVISGNSDEIIKIETALITIPVSVFDRNGLYIPNLAKENFKIFENDKEQEIAYFGTPEKPFTVVLLLDTSPSTEFKIEEIQDAAIAFVNQLKPNDKMMVVEFDENMHVLAKPTNDKEKLYKAIRKADFGGGTSLYDAVDFALRKYLDKIEGRKAIVLFTDGVDTTSDDATYQSTLYQTEEEDVLIFPIYYNTYSENNRLNGVINFPFPRRRILARGTSLEEYRIGKKYLEEIAEQTGGRVFPAETPVGLKNAFTGIAEELRRQYNIGYYPSEIGENGERKLIKVRVNRPNLVIRARGSYIVGSGN